jgi:hypothetical protein
MSIMVAGMTRKHTTVLGGLTFIQMGIIHFILDNGCVGVQESGRNDV